MSPSDSGFNPYSAWLGLDRSITQPNHYQLLGIGQQERDAQRITAAAENAIARVRGCRPGGRSARWARLLDELSAARACLLDPARRAQYDRQLSTAGAPAGRPFKRPASRTSAPTPGTVPSGSAQQAGSKLSGPRSVPMSGPIPVASAAQSAASHAGDGGTSPGGMPKGLPVGAAASRPTAATSSVPAVVATKNRSMDARRSRHSTTSPIIIAAGACLILLGIILLLVLFGTERKKPRHAQSEPLTSNRPTQRESRSRSRPAAKARPAAEARPATGRVRPPVREYSAEQASQTSEPTEPSLGDAPSANTVDDQPWTLPEFPQLDTSLEPRSKAETSTTEEPAEPPNGAVWISPDEAPAVPTSAEPAADAVEPVSQPPVRTEMKPPGMQPGTESKQDSKTLSATMAAARGAALAGNLDGARNELAKVASVPKSPEEQTRYDRLNLLVQYARNFQAALREAFGALEAGDELEAGESAVVGVVGTTATSITVRVQGANRTYPLDSLPPGLAVAIANTWLDQDDPVSLVMKGAYLVTLKNTDAQQLAKARQWFREAFAKDPELADFEQVLDDTQEP